MVVQAPDKPLPEAPAKDWRENNVQISQIDDAINLLRSPQGRNATGLWQGVVNAIPGVGTSALNLLDSEGKATRALVTQIASAKITNTSGTAVSVGEEARFKPWIPQVGDENDTVILKLEGFKREYQKMQEEIAQQARQQGQKSPGQTPATRPTDAPAVIRPSTGNIGADVRAAAKANVDTTELEAQFRASRTPTSAP